MSETQQEIVLQLSRRYDASPERVFDAWTSPEVLKQWWFIDPTWETEVADVDLRPGGRYRLGMTEPGGKSHVAVGEYTEVSRPDKIAFTWQWEGQDAVTLVEVAFVEDGDATEVTLTHSGFASQESSASHSHGWNHLLDSLGGYFSK
jgi:uncharacterized protein YndB with AHSA1/START domain